MCRVNSCILSFVLVMTCLFVVNQDAFGALSLDFQDPLTSSGTVAGESAKNVTGGNFVANGWQSTSSSSKIMITLSQAFAPGESGALELDITNWDPVNQYTGEKHQFFNLYSRPDGSKADWHDVGKCWWNIRGGTNYMSGSGAGFKFLFVPRGLDSRHEVRLLQSRSDWDENETYTFRVEWTTTQISIFLDGTRLFGPYGFSGRTEGLKYIFLGKDNVYGGFAGPIYTALRVYREEGGSSNTAPIANNDSYDVHEGTVLTIAAPGVLDNDTDADDDSLTAVEVDSPSNGDLTLNADGSFTYTPDAGFTGTDSFTYRADDGTDQSPQATVTIRVTSEDVNNAPVVEAGVDTTVSLDFPALVDLDGTITDDGFPSSDVSYQWSVDSGPGTVLFGDASADDTTVMAFISGEYTLMLTADDGELTGSDTMTLTVTDGRDNDGDGSDNDVDADDDNDGTPDAQDDDLDGDGVNNADELEIGYDPSDGTSFPDNDSDGTPDLADDDIDDDGTPNDQDTDRDGDGASNDDETAAGTDPDDKTSTPNDTRDNDDDGTNNGADADDDNDGIPDTQDADRDGDGVPNGDEFKRGTDPNDNTDFPDNDADGITDNQDADDDNDGTPDASDSDRDGDGFDNDVELANGTDPDNNNSFPEDASRSTSSNSSSGGGCFLRGLGL